MAAETAENVDVEKEIKRAKALLDEALAQLRTHDVLEAAYEGADVGPAELMVRAPDNTVGAPIPLKAVLERGMAGTGQAAASERQKFLQPLVNASAQSYLASLGAAHAAIGSLLKLSGRAD